MRRMTMLAGWFVWKSLRVEKSQKALPPQIRAWVEARKRHRVGAENPVIAVDLVSRGRSSWPVMVENPATGAGLGFYAACWYSLISPASRALRWIRAAGTGKVMRSGSSSGARRPMPSPWWLRPVL